MARTWVVVAHRAGARFFENTGPGKGLALVREISHPEGKLKNGDINSDRQGRAFDSRGMGRHAYEPAQQPKEHVAELFARHLSSVLDEARNTHQVDRVVLVAEPKFLGILRGTLSPQTAALVVGTVDKDLAGSDVRDISSHLANVMVV